MWEKIECNKFYRVAVTVALAAFLTLLADKGIDRFITDNRHPIRSWGEAYAVPDEIARGAKVIGRIYRDKVRRCPVESRRSAVRHDGLTYDVPDKFHRGGKDGTEYVEIEYDVSALPPGQYRLEVYLTYRCPERTYTSIQPPIHFRIKGTG